MTDNAMKPPPFASIMIGAAPPAKIEVTIAAPGFAPQKSTFEGGGGIVIYHGIVIDVTWPEPEGQKP